jgi:hypothetical protein
MAVMLATVCHKHLLMGDGDFCAATLWAIQGLAAVDNCHGFSLMP